jgi:hypothetical protein
MDLITPRKQWGLKQQSDQLRWLASGPQELITKKRTPAKGNDQLHSNSGITKSCGWIGIT